MDKYEVRRLRLIELMNSDCSGKASEIAKKIDRSESYVSRMMYPEGKPGKKRIGEDMAKLITEAFKLPPYWLDGEIAPISESPQAREVAKAFDALNAVQQQAVITMIESYGQKIPRFDSRASVSSQQTKSDNHIVENSGKKQSSASS